MPFALHPTHPARPAPWPVRRMPMWDTVLPLAAAAAWAALLWYVLVLAVRALAVFDDGFRALDAAVREGLPSGTAPETLIPDSGRDAGRQEREYVFQLDAEARIDERIGEDEHGKIQQVVDLLRSQQVRDADGFLDNPHDVVRFVRARGGNVPKAAQMLRETLRWRSERLPWAMHCPACEDPDTPGLHALRQVGFDDSGRPVIYTCFRQCIGGGLRNGNEHLVYCIENAMRTCPQRAGKWIWLLDYAGFGVAHMSLNASREPIKTLSSYYPERLHRVIMLNPPAIFKPFIRMLKPFIDPKTYAKACIVRGKSDSIHAQLRDILGPKTDVVPWVIREMEANRRNPFPREQRAFWMKPAASDASAEAHDPRGGTYFIDNFLRPEQATLEETGPRFRGNALPHPEIVATMTGKRAVDLLASRSSTPPRRPGGCDLPAHGTP